MQQQDTTVVSPKADSPTARTSTGGNSHWLLIISVLLALLVVGVWSQDAPVTAMAQEKSGKVPPIAVDLAVAQRYDMIAELSKVNSKLDRIGDLLSSGQVKVVVIQDDKKAEEVRHEATTKP